MYVKNKKKVLSLTFNWNISDKRKKNPFIKLNDY